MSEPTRPLLPANRAFVIQLRAETEIRRGGRVEHLVSGEAAHFEGGAELWAFIDEVLVELDESSATEQAAAPEEGGDA